MKGYSFLLLLSALWLCSGQTMHGMRACPVLTLGLSSDLHMIHAAGLAVPAGTGR